MEHYDKYLWMEDLNSGKVNEFIDSENKRFRKFVGRLPNNLLTRVIKYFNIPYVTSIKATMKGYFMLLRTGRSYKIVLVDKRGEKSTIIDSKELGKDIVLQSFNVNLIGNRLAYSYSYAGSDEGIIKIIDIDSMEYLDELRGVISEIVWLDRERYYYVRFYRKGKTPDGVNAPAERVFLREGYSEENMVFGEGLDTSYFVSLKRSLYSDKMMISISYGWTWSDLYGGDVEDPSDWSKIYGEGKCIVNQ
jgi:prolyl oligopeptidase